MAVAQSDTPETFWTPLPHINENPISKINIDENLIIHPTTEQVQSVSTNPPSFTRCQLAEIQLAGIINDPELNLSCFVNDPTIFELDEVARRLRTQPWIIKRVVRTLGIVNMNILSTREVHMLTRVLTGSFDARALLFFDIIDMDGDRQVTREELIQFFTDYLDGIASLKLFNEAEEGKHRQTIIKMIVDKFLLNQALYIDFDQFYELVVSDQVLIEILSKFTVHPTWFHVDQMQIREETTDHKEKKDHSLFTMKGIMLLSLQSRVRMYQGLYDALEKKASSDYFHANISRILFASIYMAVSLALFIYVIIHRIKLHTSWLEVIARICGMQLNFNCMLMIVLMLRHSARFIRSIRLLHILIPVDDTIAIHAMVGRWIAVLVFIHALFHMIYFGVEGQGYSWAEIMFTARAKIGWIHITPLLGVILSTVLGIMVICSMRFVRRGGHFEVFYWTHLLYIVFYILLILHARNFWHWFIGPAFIFALEQMYYFYKRHSKNKGRTLLHSVTIEQANVIKLSIHRPPEFHFRSGDYVLLKIPGVARSEWHPFTLSSAPEDQKLLTVHIQSVGDWTTKVFERYKKMVADGPIAFGVSDAEAPNERIWIDGPYASSARHISHCAHVILIGAGIGITPYASILSSFLAQYHARASGDVSLGSKGRTIKLDFVWINRSVDNFEWFLKLLANFEQEQELRESMPAMTKDKMINGNNGRFLDLHLYFTGIKHDTNIGSVPLDLVARVYEQTYNEDIFTRLKAKTHVGRPNWNELFEEILAKGINKNRRDVGVFFCGPLSMGEEIKVECRKHQLKFHKEIF